MKNSNWKDTAELIGIAAIVASLLFVGLQMKQSQEIAIAAQYQARLDTLMNQMYSIAESDVGLRVYGEDLKELYRSTDGVPAEAKAWAENVPSEELAWRTINSYSNLKSFDNLHFQFEAGFLDEETWLGMREQLKDNLASPGGVGIVRRLYEYEPHAYRPSYREVIDGLIADIDAESE